VQKAYLIPEGVVGLSTYSSFGNPAAVPYGLGLWFCAPPFEGFAFTKCFYLFSLYYILWQDANEFYLRANCVVIPFL